MRKLSVVIPAYNEERFIGSLLKRVLETPTETKGFTKEVVVVDDGSKDGTGAAIQKFPQVRYMRQENKGKGAAVQYGISVSTGDYVLVQDADLEYDPADYLPMLEALPAETQAVVYGSRTKGQMRNGFSWTPGKHPNQSMGAWVANIVLSLWTFILYRVWVTDPLTAYKLYPISFLKENPATTTGFETDHELTAKIVKRKIPILEVPIAYTPRSVREGKKIKASDGLIAMWTLLKFRWMN